MAQVNRSDVNIDAESARRAPQLSGLLAGENGIKRGMPCRVNSSGAIVRSDATSAGEAAKVHGFAATDADNGDPVSLYGEGTRFRYDGDGGLTEGQTLFLDANPGELNTAPQAGDPDGVAVAVSSKDIVVTRTTQAAPRASAVISGGAAGDHTVTGIAVGDVLELVIQFVGGGTDVTDVADLTGEFTIDSADTINNDGGTATSGDKLLVVWRDLT